MSSRQQRARPRPAAKGSRSASAERPASAEVEKIASLDRPRRTDVPPLAEPRAEQPIDVEPVIDGEPVGVELAADAGDALPAAADMVADEAVAAEDAQPMAGRPTSVADTLAHVDRYWRAFQALALRFPRTRIDEPLGRSWTRKQMLAHVAAWHDRTADRLLAFTKSGAIQPLTDEIDAFNARVARAAIGRTSGEVVGALEASFNRLRRQIGLLTDEQLRAHGGWAAAIIAANTYDHYDEHAADLQPAGLSSAP